MRQRTLFSVVAIAVLFISLVHLPLDSEGVVPGTPLDIGVIFAGGTGTLADPYQVSNITQLQNISSDLNSHYILINDISASSSASWDSGKGFDPIGTLGSEFNGTFDGRGYSIFSLEIDRSSIDGIGLFGYTGPDSMISNMELTGNISGRANVGALVGFSLGTIDRVNTSCNVTGTNNAVGGLVGFNEGDISFCISGFHTTGRWYLGGLVGQNNGGMILECSSYGTVLKKTGGNIGGLIGRNTGMVMNCNSSCFVSGTGMNAVGGLIGYNNGPVDLCNATGDVFGSELVGGLIGITLDTISNSFAEGDVFSSGSDVGGITGKSGDAFSTSASVVNCFSSGDVTGSWWYVGGIVGRNFESIINCYNTGNVSGVLHRIGGIAGFNSKNIDDSYNTGSVSGSNEVGGIAGFMYTAASITRCYSLGDVDGDDNVGGLAGNCSSDTCVIQESAAFGDVSGIVDHVGGVVGRNLGTSAVVQNCYAVGDVSGRFDVGGIVGWNDGQVDFCYSIGRVSGTSFVGGVIGTNAGVTSNCFWDNITSNILTSSGGSGKDTTDMMKKGTFTSWDIGYMWDIVENRTYPYLGWLPKGDPMITSDNYLYAVEEENYYQDYDAFDDPVSENPLHWFLDEGPSWLDIGLYTGDLFGTPENEDVGPGWVNISVYDGTGSYNYTRFMLTVNNTNDPVDIYSDPVELATEDENYSYPIGITDDDLLNPSGEVLYFSLDESPEGMSIDQLDGNFTWVPTNEQAHQGHNVTLNVTDGEMFVTQSYSVWVININDPVVINSAPIQNATQDHLYVYHVNATDDDLFNPSGEELYFSLDTAPEGMTIMEQIGTIRWVPTNGQVQRYHNVTVNVTDGDMFTLQEFQIYVDNYNDPVLINSTPVTDAYEEIEYSYQVEAWDRDFLTPGGEDLAYSLFVSPFGMDIDIDTGLITWIPTNEQAHQEHEVRLNVTDGEHTIHQVFEITVHNVNDAPQINSTPVVEATEDLHYSYLVEVWDDDLANPSGEELNIAFDEKPEGMMFGDPANLIVWVPKLAQSGMYHEVVINVTDGEEFALQSFTIFVEKNTPEKFNITIGPILFEDDSVADGLNVTLISEDDTEYVAVTDVNGNFSFNHVYPGFYDIVIEGPVQNYTFILNLSFYGVMKYRLPKIDLPVVVDDDIIDDDTVDDDTSDDDDDSKDNSNIFVIITVAAVILLLIAAILIYLCYRKCPMFGEE